MRSLSFSGLFPIFSAVTRYCSFLGQILRGSLGILIGTPPSKRQSFFSPKISCPSDLIPAVFFPPSPPAIVCFHSSSSLMPAVQTGKTQTYLFSYPFFLYFVFLVPSVLAGRLKMMSLICRTLIDVTVGKSCRLPPEMLLLFACPNPPGFSRFPAYASTNQRESFPLLLPFRALNHGRLPSRLLSPLPVDSESSPQVHPYSLSF